MPLTTATRSPLAAAASTARARIPFVPLLAVTLAIVSCSAIRWPRHDSAKRAGVEGQVSPESVFVRFLDLAVATRLQRMGMHDSVYACRELEYLEDVRWVADYRVTSVAVRGDEADATAVLTTVAQQIDRGENNGGYVATLRIRSDTGRWLLRKSGSTAGHWKVCGDSREHFGIYMLGREAKWLPAGASADKARAAIDSIRSSRALPILR